MTKFFESNLYKALQEDNEELVIKVLSEDAKEAKLKAPDGRSFLHVAVELKCKLGIVKELLKHSDIAERDEEGDTMLDKVLEKDDKDLAEILTDFIDEILFAGDTDKLEEMMLAGWEVPRPSSAKRKQIREASEAMDVMLDNLKGFEDRVKDIHRAINDGNVRLLRQLIDKKKIAKARDETGLFPLHKAIVFDQMEIIKYLAEEFPELINKKDNLGRTPLHYAAVTTDSRDKYKLLVDNGADETIEDIKDHTPKYYQEHPDEIDLVAFRQKLTQILEKPRRHLRSRGLSKAGRQSRTSRPGSRGSSAGSERTKTTESKRSVQSGSIQLDVKPDPYVKKNIPPPKTEDALYCANELGEVLTLALAEVVDKRPWDPIEFLAHWLHKYSSNKLRLRRKKTEDELMVREQAEAEKQKEIDDKCQEERAKLEEEEREKQQKEEEERRQQQEEEDRRQREHSMLSGPGLPTLKEEEEEQAQKAEVQLNAVRDENGLTELHRAATQDGVDLAAMVDKGFTLAVRDVNGKTARDLAEEAGKQENVEAFDKIVYGYFENGKTDDIMMLILNGYTQIPNLTEKYGEDGTGLDEDAFEIWKNISETQESLTSMQQAIMKGSVREVRQNLDRKIYSKTRDSEGRSLLHLAVLYHQTEIIEYLLENFPVLVTFTDNHDRTALHYAAAVDKQLEELLVKAGADQSAKDIKQNPTSYYEEHKEEILSYRTVVAQSEQQEGQATQEEQAEGQEGQTEGQQEGQSEGQQEEGQAEEGQQEGQAEEGQAEGQQEEQAEGQQEEGQAGEGQQQED